MTDDERIEKVLSEMDRKADGRLSVQQYLSEIVQDKDAHSYKRIITFLVEKGFARSLSSMPILEILPAGLEIVKSGGYIKYLERLKAMDEEETLMRKTKAELEEVNLKLNRFLLKYKWFPYILSGLAILISIIAIIISIVKS